MRGGSRMREFSDARGLGMLTHRSIAVRAMRAAISLRNFAYARKADWRSEQGPRGSEGAVVFQLKEKTTASRADFDKNKAALLGPMTAAKATEALALYVAELKKNVGSKLKTDARFAEEPKSAGRNDEE